MHGPRRSTTRRPVVPPGLRLLWQTGTFGPLLIWALLTAVILRWLPLQARAPQLRTLDETEVPLTLLLVLPLATAIQTTTVEPSADIHRTGTPLRRQAGLARVGILLIVLTLTTTLIATQHQPAAAVIAATATGEALLCGRICGPRLAWLLPGIHATAAAFLGATTLIGRAWWAWPAAPNPTVTDIALAALTLILGLIAHTVRRRPTTRAP